MATLVGQTLGKYQIIERLGRGGMAEVYKARHPTLDRFVAIKVMHHFLVEGQEFTARFLREAKAIAALHHPNIVQVYDFETQDELHYMVMEFVDGGTLKDRLMQSSAPLPYAEIGRIIGETAAALEYAHRQGVLHRDIKPANVLLSKDGRVVLTDFGIARILSDTQFTVTGALVGTPVYMSPEQGKGLHVGAASDLYSLGVILYEMVTGKVPYNSDTPLAVIQKHINEPLPHPSTLRPDIPPALEAVIEKALEKSPTDRYQNTAEFKNALEEALKGISASQQESQRTLETNPPSLNQTTPEVYEKATVAMLPEDDPIRRQTFTSRPTVAMESDAENIVGKDTVDLDAEIKASKGQKGKKTQNPLPGQSHRWANKTKLIFGVIGLALIAFLLIWGIPKLFRGYGSGNADCTSIEECQLLAEEGWSSGNIDSVVSALEKSISFVPDSEHPAQAHLWCQRGEALTALNRIDEAIGNFEECIAWTEGSPDPGLENLRVYAQGQIDMLNNR